MPKTYLETKEVTQLEDAAGYLRDKLLIRLLFHLGCRISEALGIAAQLDPGVRQCFPHATQSYYREWALPQLQKTLSASYRQIGFRLVECSSDTLDR